METKKLFELPIGQAGCGHIRVISSGVEWCIQYNYMSDRQWRFGGLLFEDVSAFRYIDEQHGYHIPDSYDSVVEVVESEWLEKLVVLETPGLLGSVASKRHLAVF